MRPCFTHLYFEFLPISDTFRGITRKYLAPEVVMPKDEITPTIEKAQGRRAKIKTLKEMPSNTKVKKLDPKLQKAFEESFPKAKLRLVRVHTGKDVQQACKSIGSRAFSFGNGIYLSKPGYAKDLRFMAHEMAHVIQSGKGKMPKEQGDKVYVTK
jgi:hypothetical protein